MIITIIYFSPYTFTILIYISSTILTIFSIVYTIFFLLIFDVIFVFKKISVISRYKK